MTVSTNVSAGNELGYLLVAAAAPTGVLHALRPYTDANKFFVYNGIKGGSVKEAAGQADMAACLAGNR